MYLWIIKRPNILAYLENISVALYVEEISAECRVINERIISYSQSCKSSRLYELAFGSQLRLYLLNSYSETQSKTKYKQNQNKEMFCLVYQGVLLCFFFIASLMVLFSIAVPLPQQLSMKLTVSLLLKNTIDLLFFFGT